MPELVRGLSVDGVVETGILPAGENLQLTAKLIRGRDLDVVWARTVLTSKAELIRNVADLAANLAREAGIDVSAGGARRITALKTVDPEVYRLVTLEQNLDLWDREQQQVAHRYLSEARLRDPLYAPAYRAVAEVLEHQLLQDFVDPEYAPQVVEAARKAVELDSLDANNYLTLADVEFFMNWDRAAAESLYARAVALNPSIFATDQRSSFLIWTGRFDEGLAEIERAVRIDPGNKGLQKNLVWSYLNAHRYAEARAQVPADSITGNPVVDANYLLILGMMDSLARAADLVDQALVGQYPSTRGELMLFGWVYGMAGRKTDARRLLDSLTAFTARNSLPENPSQRLVICAAMEDDRCALQSLEQMIRERQPNVMWLGSEPMIPDRLRANPRFRELMSQAGFGAWVGAPVSRASTS
jgi:tetratricopeptide (TPR) repeat protein